MSVTSPDDRARPAAGTPASAGRRLRYKLRIAASEPTTLIGIMMAALFAYLIVVPIIAMLLDAVTVQLGDERRIEADVGGLTWYYLERTFTSRVAHNLFWGPLVNTLSVALGAIVVAMAVGGTLAWLLARTDMFGRRWFATALIVPYMLPAWTFALAWTTLFKNRTVGGQAGWLETFGFSPPDWLAYGRVPVTIILALHYAPFIILLFGNALRRFDSQLEDSARILGAGRLTVMRQVILPLMRPALMSAMVLIFAKCLGEFGVPYVLGLPVAFDTLATSLYQNIASRQIGRRRGARRRDHADRGPHPDHRRIPDARGAAVRDHRLEGLDGPAEPARPLALGRDRVRGADVRALSVGLPLLTLFLSTVMKVPARFTLDNFTLDYWIGTGLNTVALQTGILLSPDLWNAAWNSLRIVGVASLTSGLLGLLVGYVVVRTPVRPLGTFLRQVTFLPYLVPGIAFATAYLSLFAVPRGPIPALYGTSLILMLALIADQMPYASRAGIAAMMQLGKDPEEAAQVAGAGWLRRMTSIVIPIQKGALTTGVLLALHLRHQGPQPLRGAGGAEHRRADHLLAPARRLPLHAGGQRRRADHRRARLLRGAARPEADQEQPGARTGRLTCRGSTSAGCARATAAGAANAVEDLDLEIADGEFMCLLGPSGCGKTTTLRMIAGLEHLSDGEIRVGSRVVELGRRRGVRAAREAARWGSCSRATRSGRT